MGRLLRFEIRKLFRQTSFYVCLAVLCALVFLGIFSTYSMIRLAKTNLGVELDLETLEMFGFDVDLNGRRYLLTALGGNNLTMLLGIFIALYVCSDYVNQTAKNIIGRGYSRTSFVAAKELVTAAGTLIFCLTACGLSFAIATGYWGAGKAWALTDLYRLLVQLLSVLAYAAFFSFFSFLLKKSGGAIAFNIIVPAVLSLVLTIVDIFTTKQEFFLSEYWLAYCLEVSTNLDAELAELAHCGIVAAGYLVVFVLLTHLIVGRQDV